MFDSNEHLDSGSDSEQIENDGEREDELIDTELVTENSGLRDDVTLEVAGFLTGLNYGFFAAIQSPDMARELVIGFLLVAGGIRASNGKLANVNKTPYASIGGLIVGLVMGTLLRSPETLTDLLG